MVKPSDNSAYIDAAYFIAVQSFVQLAPNAVKGLFSSFPSPAVEKMYRISSPYFTMG
jgi:hypothetical protein